MREASKTRAARADDFYDVFMSARVLDIGCGDDLCVPHAVPFDQEQGDANEILAHFAPESFDCVHSSHCLEHVFDPIRCLNEWWSLIKPGGFLITVVPDEDFYEQGNWPSLFNPDHKSTFRLDGAYSWSPVSFCLPGLIGALPGACILSAKRQVDGYLGEKLLLGKRSSAGHVYRRPASASRFRDVKGKVCNQARRWITQAGLTDTFLDRLLIDVALMTRSPVDQTLGNALAQIEVIAQKQALQV
jgi:SAM-dependent methyltransferase